MAPLLPGDRLWNRYRVESIERAVFHGAWLSPLQSGSDSPAAKALLELHALGATPLAALLGHLAPGSATPPPAPKSKRKKTVEAPTPPASLPLLGDVEWFGSPGSGHVAVLPAPAATPLATWSAKHGALSAAQALPVVSRLARDLHALVARTQDVRRKKVPGDVLRAIAACITPAGLGLLNSAPNFTLLPFAGETHAARVPPAWAEAQAPEFYLDDAPSLAALVFNVARIAAFLLGAWKNPLPRNEAAWGALALWTAGKRDPAKEFADAAAYLKTPETFVSILQRALHKKAARRFASLDKFAAALDTLATEAWAHASSSCTRCRFVLQPGTLSRKECPVCGAPVPPQAVASGSGGSRASSPGTTRLRKAATQPAAASAETTATLDAVAEGMCVIEAGPYLSGEDLTPRTLRAFAIDKLPVTEGDYKNFLINTNREPRPGGPGGRPCSMDNLPVTNITWHEAVEFAESQGKRLPTVYEWEKAARGVDGRKFPFGNQFKPGIVKLRSTDNPDGPPEVRTVGSQPKSASPYGVQDMVGNVLQWTTTARRSGEKIYRAVKGSCAADSAPDLMRCSGVQFLPPDTTDSMVGFRCVKDLE